MSVVECERPREPARGELRSVTAAVKAKQTGKRVIWEERERKSSLGCGERRGFVHPEDSLEDTGQAVRGGSGRRQQEADRQGTPGPRRALSFSHRKLFLLVFTVTFCQLDRRTKSRKTAVVLSVI